MEPYRKTAYFDRNRPSEMDGMGAPEYGPVDKVNKEKALVDIATVMYPQLKKLDYRHDLPALAVPIYLVDGA